jgi:tetratricopeptide (TPR) repeat protein
LVSRAAAGVVALVVVLAGTAGVRAQVTPAEAVKLANEGAKAIEEKRFADALASFTAAAKLSPRSADIAFGVGLSAFMLGQNAEAERQFQRTLQIDPSFTGASVFLGELQYRAGRLKEAIATYEAAQKLAPNDSRLKLKIEEWSAAARTESRYAETRSVHFRALFEGPVDQALARRAVDILEATYLRIGDALQFYPTQPVDVVLHTSQQFRDITRGPAWLVGVYDGRIRVPVKGALEQRGDLERVLSHEYVHALVDSVASRGVPTWLNEGLAVALEPGALANAERVVSAARSRPRLSELETGFGDLPEARAQLAYAESALAARKALEARGPSGVILLLRDLGAGVPFRTAFQQRIGVRYEEFQDAVARR